MGLKIFFVYHKKRLKCPLFCYQELKEATNGIQEELGRGSIGIDNMGIISGEGPPICVAVKKLDRGDSDKEFNSEINVIGRTYHKNLVQFVGFCKDTKGCQDINI